MFTAPLPVAARRLQSVASVVGAVLLFFPSVLGAGDAGARRVQIQVPEKPDLADFVRLEGGCFHMGDPTGKGHKGERPVHEVCVDTFLIAKHEVTQREWTWVMGSNPSSFRPCPLCPVEQITWDDLQKFLKTLNRKTKKQFRLPTEAEWEYAARAHGRHTIFSGTDDAHGIGDYAWYLENSTTPVSRTYKKSRPHFLKGVRSHPVAQLKPNALGLYDMGGNVWELVSDWYDTTYYQTSPKKNPAGPQAPTKFRLIRGGSMKSLPENYLRISARAGFGPGWYKSDVGFRLAHPVR